MALIACIISHAQVLHRTVDGILASQPIVGPNLQLAILHAALYGLGDILKARYLLLPILGPNDGQATYGLVLYRSHLLCAGCELAVTARAWTEDYEVGLLGLEVQGYVRQSVPLIPYGYGGDAAALRVPQLGHHAADAETTLHTTEVLLLVGDEVDFSLLGAAVDIVQAIVALAALEVGLQASSLQRLSQVQVSYLGRGSLSIISTPQFIGHRGIFCIHLWITVQAGRECGLGAEDGSSAVGQLLHLLERGEGEHLIARQEQHAVLASHA